MPPTDNFIFDRVGPSAPVAPARRQVALTPSDSTDLAELPRSIYVGVAGNVNCTLADDSGPSVLQNLPVGYHPLRVKRLYATSTTASAIVALY